MNPEILLILKTYPVKELHPLSCLRIPFGNISSLNSVKDSKIIVTDDEDLARSLSDEGFCVIGYQEAEGDESDRGVLPDMPDRTAVKADPTGGKRLCPPDKMVSESARDGAYFRGVSEVITSLDALDSDYIGRVWRRFRGLPVTVARTGRLVIRESIAEDFEDLYRMAEDGRAEPEVREEFISYIRSAYRFYGFGLWTVVRKGDGKIIGRCGLSPQADAFSPEGRIEIGYLIDRQERKKGYAKEACEAILSFAFQNMDLEQVYARIDRRNTASNQLASDLGFLQEIDLKDGTVLWKKCAK